MDIYGYLVLSGVGRAGAGGIDRGNETRSKLYRWRALVLASRYFNTRSNSGLTTLPVPADDDDYIPPASQARPSSQLIPPPQQPASQQYSPRIQPQYINDDDTPSPEADDFYQSEKPPYKPAAPGPPRSITNQSVWAHSPTILTYVLANKRPSLPMNGPCSSTARTPKRRRDPDLQFVRIFRLHGRHFQDTLHSRTHACQRDGWYVLMHIGCEVE